MAGKYAKKMKSMKMGKKGMKKSAMTTGPGRNKSTKHRVNYSIPRGKKKM